MSYEKFKEFVLDTDPEKMIYHLYKHGLFIRSQVISVEKYLDDEGILVEFLGGSVQIWKEYKISECRMPDMLLTECEICFRLKNEYDDHIGFLYIPKVK